MCQEKQIEIRLLLSPTDAAKFDAWVKSRGFAGREDALYTLINEAIYQVQIGQ